MTGSGGSRQLTFQIFANEVAYQGFFKIEKVSVAFDKLDGTRTEPQTLEVAQRGDAVAALLFDPDRRVVILVRQFRLPTTRPFRRPVVGPSTPNDLVETYETKWLLETVAGTIRIVPDSNPPRPETPEECLRREIEEEVGYFVSELEPVARFFTSPGGSNETIHLYLAKVAQWQRRKEGGGDGRIEIVEPVEMDLDEFLLRHIRQEFEDGKLIIAGYWLRDYLAREERGRIVKRQAPPRLHALTNVPTPKSIGVVAGDLTEIENVHVWVNPENSNMQMDRVFGKSVSAAIRWKGAKRGVSPEGIEYIEEDTIADALRKKMGNRHFVTPTEIVVTGPGQLASKKVRAIMHVAVANGFYEQRLQTNLPTLRRCVEEVLARIHRHNRMKRWDPHRSVVFPLIGTGTNGIASNKVAPEIIDASIAFLRATPDAALTTIYLNGYSTGDLLAIEEAIQERVKRGDLAASADAGAGADR